MIQRFEPTMIRSEQTAREIFEEVRANPARARFGFGQKLAILNVDPQNAYTRPDLFPKTAYVTDPDQLSHINRISKAARAKGLPVIWTHVAYMDNAADAGVWGTRTDTPDSLQNIKYGSDRHAFDARLEIDEAVDAVYTKRMPSAFFRDAAGKLLDLAPGRHGGDHRRFHIGLRARHCGRCVVARLPRDCPGGVCGRQA